MVDLRQIVESAGFDPVGIGEMVLIALGYRVLIMGFECDSLLIRVYDSDGTMLFERSIGLD